MKNVMRLKKTLTAWLLLLTAGGIIGGVWWLQRTQPSLEPQAGIPITELLGEDERFAQAEGPKELSFPRDHGSHPNYQTESWYFTGHLTSEEDRRFGFQLNFFRVGLQPPDTPPRSSAWATQGVYRSHFALTDVNHGHFQAFERFSRAALGLSGAERAPVRVWLEDWSIEVPEEENSGFHLQAATDEAAIDLTLHGLKPPLLPEEGQSGGTLFHSYQFTRLRAQGTLQIDHRTFPVEGTAWLGRAWGAVPVPAGPVVWDRFLLQLEDGRELLGFRLRRRDGSGTPINSGLLVSPEGTTQALGREDLNIEILDYWESPRDETRYPAGWRFHLPNQGIDLELTPYVKDQELDLLLRYWGGVVEISGKDRGQPVKGQGYVELTGYGT